MTGVLAASSSTNSVNPTAVLISVGIPFVICASIAVIVWAYFRLQAHRADAVAMAEYRRLAEEAVANQQELRSELAKLTVKVDTVEKLMREVG
jgi:predicted negative regulator of RcsB-dependent stress response